MGWEKRGNGRYYYRKRRVGGRVVSDYVGSSEMAGILARFEHLSRQHSAETWRQWIEERDADLEMDRELREIERLVRDLKAAVLIAHGYRTHRRQWRRNRHEPT